MNTLNTIIELSSTKNKTETHKAVTKLLDALAESTEFKSIKAKTEFTSNIALITEFLKPKLGGTTDKIPTEMLDGVEYHHCSYTKKYYTLENMVMSNGKPKTTSKVGMATRARGITAIDKLVADLKDQALDLLMSGKIEEGTAKKHESEAKSKDKDAQIDYSNCSFDAHFVDGVLVSNG